MSYKINKYPDGSKYIVVEHFNKELTFRINSYEDLWLLNQLVDVYNNNGLVPHITIPNLLDAQADRRFKENQPHSLKLVCNFLNEMNAYFRIFHPHNPEVVEALMDNVEIIDNSDFIKQVFRKLRTMSFSRDMILMASDAGGFKPLMKLCDKLKWKGEVYSASKSRSYKNGSTQLEQIIDRKDFGGKDVLIIDDISVYGGTFKGLSVMLREKNVGKLYLAVSHMTVSNLGDDPVTNYYDEIFTTNSKFNTYRTPATGHDKLFGQVPDNLKVISLF